MLHLSHLIILLYLGFLHIEFWYIFLNRSKNNNIIHLYGALKRHTYTHIIILLRIMTLVLWLIKITWTGWGDGSIYEILGSQGTWHLPWHTNLHPSTWEHICIPHTLKQTHTQIYTYSHTGTYIHIYTDIDIHSYWSKNKPSGACNNLWYLNITPKIWFSGSRKGLRNTDCFASQVLPM